MATNLKDKTVVITGGAQGIGYNIAENFIKESAKVIIVDISEEKGKAAVEKLKNDTVFIKFDLTNNPGAVFEEIIEKNKQIDILVNNAGVADEDVQKAIDINFTASITLSLKFYEHMKENGGGTIINISSIVGYEVTPFLSVYQATKSGLLALSRSLGHEHNFQKFGVKVIALCPGFTKTNLTKPILEKDLSVPVDILEYTESFIWQEVNCVGEAAIEICKTAPSGSVWEIEGGKLQKIHFEYRKFEIKK